MKFMLKTRKFLIAVVASVCLLPSVSVMAQSASSLESYRGDIKSDADKYMAEHGNAEVGFQEENTANWRALKNYEDQLSATLGDISAKMAAGQPIDWNQIGATYGMSDLTPDEIFDRLNSIYNEVNDYTSNIEKLAYEQYGDENYGTGGQYDPAEWYMRHGTGNDYQRLVLHLEMDYLKNKIINPTINAPPTKLPDMTGGGDTNSNNGSFFDVSYMLSQIEKQIPALIRLVIAIGYLSGFIMIVLAVMKLKAYGQQTVMSSQHAQLGPSIAFFVIGAILMFLPSMVQIATNSVMTGGGDAAYSYMGSGSATDFGYASLFSAIVSIIRLVGYVAFLRGWLILSKTGGHGAQPGNLGKGIIHVIGGILAINIISTWEIVRASFGFVW